MAFIDDLGTTLESAPGGGIILTTIDAIMDWSRGKSLWTMPLGTACCAMEFIAASFSRFDFDRHGSIPRSDPRHADVMVVAGTITRKMMPVAKRLYEQMPDPKWVVAMGNCTVSGGIFYYDTYSVVRGIDEFLPVDVYIAGCPPRPEAFQDAILQLRERINVESISAGRKREATGVLPEVSAPRKGDVVSGGGEDR
ncbi:MAG: NADH-quinone oxidoreductase subunit B family protein [Coriobacteriia bacterium]